MRKKILRYAISSALCGFLVIAIIIGIDRFSFSVARSEDCVSDRMYFWQHVLSKYQKEHQGEFPTSLQKAVGANSPQLNCFKTKTPYLYFPQDIKLEKGKMVVMCPRNTHGWLTKRSFGIAYDSGEWRLVNINADGTVEVGHTKMSQDS